MQTVPEPQRGTYAAFTQKRSDGMKHLSLLALAGVTHVHLLPAFDFATTNEDKSTWQAPGFDTLAALPADSSEQQALVAATADRDAFNWGYDPLHYNVPEGSYALDPDGSRARARIPPDGAVAERSGLRVVMDVVYNHTNFRAARIPIPSSTSWCLAITTGSTATAWCSARAAAPTRPPSTP